MTERIACPHCGAACFPTDDRCLSCGKNAEVARHASFASPVAQEAQTESPSARPESDAFSEFMERIPRRTWRIAGAVIAIMLGVWLWRSGLLLGLLPLGAIALFAVLWDANESMKERAMVDRVSKGGANKTALQMELLRHSRPDRIIHTRHSVVHVRGFDGRLDTDDE